MNALDIDRLYRENAGSLFRYLLKLSGDADRANDALQEAFLRLVTKPPRDKRARTWLFRVATNVIFDQARTSTRRQRLLESGPLDAGVGDVGADPHDALTRSDQSRVVRRALDKLSERDRTVLLMRAEGFEHREIAEVIEMNPKAIGVVIARAMKKLAAELRAGGS